MIKTSLHPDTLIQIFDEVPESLKLIRKCTLANGAGEHYDLFGNRYYIDQEAERLPRKWWRGMILGGDYYINIKEENEVIDE